MKKRRLHGLCYYLRQCFQVSIWPIRVLFFGEIHPSTRVHFVNRIPRPKYVSLGRGVVILINARIEAVTRYNENRFEPRIVIDDGVSVQQNLHLTCANSIYIGKNTAIGANVTITDIDHSYEDINIPIEHQDIKVSCVEIGNDCKIYNNAVILPGVKIGKHCVIGANSVVNHNIPEFSVAVGSPARVIKQYNFGTQKWENCNAKY